MIKECWCTARKVRTPTFFVSLLHVMVVVVRGIMLRLTATIIEIGRASCILLRLTAILIVVMRQIRWNGTGNCCVRCYLCVPGC